MQSINSNWTSSGIMQRANSSMYMQLRNTVSGEVKIIELEDAMLPPTCLDVVVLQLSNATTSHTFTWNKATKQYSNDVCGIFGCAVCDKGNLEERKAKMRH